MPIMMLMGNTFFHFKIFRESIINGGGEYVSLAEIFLRKLLRFCLSRLAIGSQNRTASGENSRCNKKAHPAFRQDARKIACGYFQANGINLVHFAPKSPVFLQFYIVATTQNQSMGFIVGITTMNTCKSLFLDITIRGKDYLLSFNLHLYISLYPNCTVWRMKWRKWRMAYLAYTLLYSSGTFHCANWRSRFSNSDFRSSLVTSA